MNKYKSRILDEAFLLVNQNITIRDIASKHGISKSTVHKDLREKLPKYDLNLSDKVNEILLSHKKEGYLKGGESTKNKYKTS